LLDVRHQIEAGVAVAVWNRKGEVYREYDTDAEKLSISVLSGIMFCKLLPKWRIESFYKMDTESDFRMFL
jgi:hypothetical protein